MLGIELGRCRVKKDTGRLGRNPGRRRQRDSAVSPSSRWARGRVLSRSHLAGLGWIYFVAQMRRGPSTGDICIYLSVNLDA